MWYFVHTNVLQPRHSISVFFEILQYFQQKISKNTDKSVQLEALIIIAPWFEYGYLSVVFD